MTSAGVLAVTPKAGWAGADAGVAADDAPEAARPKAGVAAAADLATAGLG